MAVDDESAVYQEFRKVVNMSADRITTWLATKESHVVGAKNGKTGTRPAVPSRWDMHRGDASSACSARTGAR